MASGAYSQYCIKSLFIIQHQEHIHHGVSPSQLEETFHYTASRAYSQYSSELKPIHYLASRAYSWCSIKSLWFTIWHQETQAIQVDGFRYPKNTGMQAVFAIQSACHCIREHFLYLALCCCMLQCAYSGCHCSVRYCNHDTCIAIVVLQQAHCHCGAAMCSSPL